MLLWVVVTRTQLTKLVTERNQGKTISMCALKAGMSRKTAGKYLSQDPVLEQRRVPHNWKTRVDPLAAIWAKAEEILRQAPELDSKALLEHLMPGDAGAVAEKHLRDLPAAGAEVATGGRP